MRRLLWITSVTAVVLFALFLLFSTLTVPAANARRLSASVAGAESAAPAIVGEWDSMRLTAPAVISESGHYRMWYDGQGSEGWAMGTATSTDNVNWSKDPANPVLSPAPAGAWDDFYRGQSTVLLEGGTYKMWYAGGTEGGAWQTGYATSTDGIDWQIYGSNPVLPVGGTGSWDEQEANGAYVLKEGGTYKMWYHGCDAGYAVCSIGYATSPDGTTWTKHGGNPVLTSTGGAWDADFLGWPRVLHNGSNYEMWYLSGGQIGHATSPDGISWSKTVGSPVISQAWDGNAAGIASVWLDGNTYRMWLNGGAGAEQGIGYMESADGINWNEPLHNPLLQPGASLGIQVNYGHDWVAGQTVPGATVVLTVGNGGGVRSNATVTANDTGDFFAGCGAWSGGQCPGLSLGDTVEASAAGLTETVGPLGSITGELDADKDLVTGTLNVPDLSGALDVRCEVWVENGPPGIWATADADGGTFTCNFAAVAWDLAPGQEVALLYFEPDGDMVINTLTFPWMRVNYGDNWVEGEYEAGHTVWITVADGSGTVKATIETETVVDGGWNGDGFSTHQEQWQPAHPDIVPGDLVHLRTDEGYTNSVEVGTIDGNLDVDRDLISGTIVAPFAEALRVECHAWVPFPVNGRDDSVIPDGSDSYTCDWSGEWNIEPAQTVAVMYVEPDADRVINTFEEAAPYLRIYKEAQGEAGAEGNLSFQVSYGNEGGAAAGGVVITDTLLGMRYLTDTSGIPAQVTAFSGGEAVRWEPGTLPAGGSSRFQLFVAVDEPVSSTLTNTILMTSTTPYNQSDRGEWEDTWEGHVGTANVEVNVDKWAWTGDPAPGNDFVFSLNPCNNGGTSSGRVTITDTVHPSLTLQSWWSATPGWAMVSDSPSALVLSRPTLESFSCAEVNLRVYLDENAWPDMAISNTVIISAAGDGDPGDNERTWWGNVNAPYTNLWVEKNWGNGKLYPGGSLIYNIGYGNDGNLPVTETFRITDTLPVSGSFVASWRNTDSGPQPVTPILVTPEQVVWEFPGLANGFNDNFQVEVAVAAEAPPGLLLVNSVRLQPLPGEDNHEDNRAAWSEILNPAGPNLRVYKRHEWQGEGRLHYEISFGNVGDETFNGIWITDTYPLSTTNAGGVGWDYGQMVTPTHNAAANQWLFQVQELRPGDQARLWFDVELEAALVGEPLAWFTNTVEIMTPAGDVTPADNGYSDVAFSGGEVEWVDVGVYDTHVWGRARQEPVTITTAHEEVNVPADFDWYAQQEFLPGDVLTITAGAGEQPVVLAIPSPYSATADGQSDMVWGQVDHLDQEWLNVDIHNYDSRRVQTDGEGRYLATFDDFPRGSNGEVRYQTSIDYANVTFHRYFRSQDLLLRVNYGHDNVEGDLPAGHTVWITVTDSAGNVKSTATVDSFPDGGWGSDGFSVEWHQWQPSQPDIVPSDWIYARADGGQTADAHVGQIGGAVDAAGDQIGGAITDTLLVPIQMLDVQCHPWGAPPEAPQPDTRHSSARSDGTLPYHCAWDPATEWDVLPAQEIAVQYYEPDGDSVLNVFQEPAPYLRLNKWADGEAGEGGNMRFTIEYWNDGEADATNVIITDTLEGMAYLYDTSPATLIMTRAIPGGEQVVLNLGRVPAGTYGRFEAFTQVLSPAGTIISNTALISTTTPYDQGGPEEKRASWQGQVAANDTHLAVDKWAWTWDPAPDTEIVFQLNVCNNGSTGSAGVWLTDTLSAGLTPVTWWADGGGWMELDRNTQRLTFYTGSVPGHRCNTLYMKGYLTETITAGEMISNSVVFTAANDLETADNEASWTGWVNDPYVNLRVEKWWGWGQLVPGGPIVYGARVSNDGNWPVTGTIRLTDTLPVSTTFSAAWSNDGQGNRQEMVPTLVADGQVVWEIAGLDNGHSLEFEVEVLIAAEATPGTRLENWLVARSDLPEANEEDNAATVVEHVYAPGPNLRVVKEGGWQDWGEDTRQAAYQIRVENVGSEPVFMPTITDTTPAGMELDGDLAVDWYRNWSWGTDPGNNLVTATLEALYPGDTAWLNFNTIVPGSGPLPAGLAYTNSVRITLDPADANPADNEDQVALSTGPDLYVEKTRAAGEGEPGAVVTFSLRFGNNHQGHEWWWNMEGMARLTETLPAGMSYLTATLRDCGGSTWCGFPPTASDGTQLTWDLWSLGSGEENEIQLAVRLTDTLTSSLFLTNQVEIASSEPLSDLEGIYTNNRGQRPLTVFYPPHFDQATVQNGSDLFLSWLFDDAYGGNGYEVWRGPSPYFLPQEPEATMIAQGTHTAATDPGTVGDGQNAYYLLLGIDDDENRHWGERLGVFEFHLTPGGN